MEIETFKMYLEISEINKKNESHMEMNLEEKDASSQLRGLFLRFAKLKEDFKELGDAGDEMAIHMFEKIDTIFKIK